MKDENEMNQKEMKNMLKKLKINENEIHNLTTKNDNLAITLSNVKQEKSEIMAVKEIATCPPTPTCAHFRTSPSRPSFT